VLKTSRNPVHIIGYGYLGAKLLKALKDRKLAPPEQIFTISRSSAEHQGHGISWDLDSDYSAPENYSVEQAIIFYFVPPPRSGQLDLKAQNYINELIRQQKKPQKIVLISTTGVYGDCQGQWIDEHSPVKPAVDRARRRVDAEQQFQNYCQSNNTPLVILRVSGIYAADKLPLKRIQAQTPVVREQDSPYSNRIHADDLLEICLIAGLKAELTGIYNCSDGHPTTMYDYFIQVARACGLAEPPSISLQQARTELSSGMLSYMGESRRINNNKLLADFKITLQFPNLEQGLAATKLNSVHPEIAFLAIYRNAKEKV